MKILALNSIINLTLNLRIMTTAALNLDYEPGPVMWISGKNEEAPEPKLTAWVNNEPKPATMQDSETGKKIAVLSFARGDSLRVEQPEAIGLCKPCTLPILGYSYDSQRHLYAITPGSMPVKFRNAETEAGGREVLFGKLPETIGEFCLVDHPKVFTLVRYKCEVNPKTKQILLPFKDKAA